MLAEHRPTGSTGGTARPYIEGMRIGTITTLSLFLASILACGEDAPTRPDDGTVDLWDACVWDGQEISALCKPELACAWHGVCVPRCEAIDECTFEGFESECNISSDEEVCVIRCDEETGCPQTGGAQLRCHQLFCVRDP